MEISKEKYDITAREKISKKVEQQKFREFVNRHKNIFVWEEETTLGKKNLENIDNFSNKESMLRRLDESRAYAFYKKDKGYYGLDVCWHDNFGVILINFNNSRVTIQFLEILLEMANYCEAMLIVMGKKQITREFIQKEKVEIEEKKQEKLQQKK